MSQQQQAPDVGARVQALREQRGLSMRALAELCDLSPNAISLIERGISSPNVSSLHRLAGALDVHITAFFEAPQARSRLVLTRRGQRPYSGYDELRLESLGSGLETRILDPFEVTLQAGAGSGQQEMRHGGHEPTCHSYSAPPTVTQERRGEQRSACNPALGSTPSTARALAVTIPPTARCIV